MEINLGLLNSALQTLYSDPDPQNKNAAQKWLIKAQRDPSAWDWSFQLLANGNPLEVQFFGAVAIHHKITHHWAELPPDKVDALRQEIFGLVFRFASGPRVVLTRSCTALAALVLHLVVEQWPSAVADIVSNFESADFPDLTPEDRCTALLEILTVLPEEYSTSKLDKSQQRQVRAGIKAGAGCVLDLLLQLIRSNQPAIVERAIKALASWLDLDLPLDSVTEHVELCFAMIKTPKYFEVAVDAIMNALNSPTSHQYANTLAHFIPFVLLLDEQLDAAIQAQDQETLLGLSKIICGLGDNHCRLVLAKIDQGGMRLIQMILKITRLPLQYPTEEACSPVSFTFWYSLQDEFEAMTLELQQNWGRLVHTLFFQFIEGLIVKLRLPELSQFSAEEKESYRVYRIDCSDALMYVYNLLNQSMLQFMADSVAHKMSRPNYDWREVEAVLFCFYSIVESCDAEGGFIQKVAQLLPQLDCQNNEHMADTVIYTVGALAEWLVDNPTFLNSLLPLVIPGLQKPTLALTAVLTLKRVTRECRFNFSPAVSLQLLLVMRQALHQGHLQPQEQLWLIQSIGHVLGAIDQEQCIQQLESVISVYVKQLNQVIESDKPIDKQLRLHIVHVISLLANLQSTLDRAAPDVEGHIQVADQRPACLVVHQLTQIFKGLLQKCGPDGDLLQAICQFYDKSVRTMVEHGVEVIDEMAELVVKIIDQAPHAAAIDLAQHILAIYRSTKPEKCFALLKVVIETVQRMRGQGHFRVNPDIAHSALELYGAVIRKMSDFFVAASAQHDPEGLMLGHMAETANEGLHFNEHPVVKGAVGFITELSRQSDQRMQETLARFGQTYVLSFAAGITGHAGRTLLDQMGDGLFIISKPNVQNFAQWLNHWLSLRRQAPNCKESDIQRSNFVQQLIRERTNKRRFRELCAQFALMARGLHGV